RSEFVARFIGGTNIFQGRWDGDSTVDCGHGLALRCGAGEFAPQGETAVSIRHHDIRFSSTRPEAAGTNCIDGTVLRQVYLGSHRDYLIALPGGESVRVVTPVGMNAAENETVWLHFPPEHCRALAR
ncbi:MAG: TOBE domain-containing protein, partial [Burkholderiaceae bacterium]